MGLRGQLSTHLRESLLQSCGCSCVASWEAGMVCAIPLSEFVQLFKISLVFPIGSVDNERRFSLMNLIYDSLRNRLQTDHVNTCVRIASSSHTYKTFDNQASHHSWLQGGNRVRYKASRLAVCSCIHRSTTSGVSWQPASALAKSFGSSCSLAKRFSQFSCLQPKTSWAKMKKKPLTSSSSIMLSNELKHIFKRAIYYLLGLLILAAIKKEYAHFCVYNYCQRLILPSASLQSDGLQTISTTVKLQLKTA
jgi:hypothetical protein